MAIDTLAKRNSVLSVNSYILPIPDSTIDQGDRQTLLRRVSSILADGAVAIIRSALNKISINIGLSI
jgi:hypothetical protein